MQWSTMKPVKCVDLEEFPQPIVEDKEQVIEPVRVLMLLSS